MFAHVFSFAEFSLALFHKYLVLISCLSVPVVFAGLDLEAFGQFAPLWMLQCHCSLAISLFRFGLCSWSAFSCVSGFVEGFERNDRHCCVVELQPFGSPRTVLAAGSHCRGSLRGN